MTTIGDLLADTTSRAYSLSELTKRAYAELYEAIPLMKLLAANAEEVKASRADDTNPRTWGTDPMPPAGHWFGNYVPVQHRPLSRAHMCAMIVQATAAYGGISPTRWVIPREAAEELAGDLASIPIPIHGLFGNIGAWYVERMEAGELEIIDVPIHIEGIQASAFLPRPTANPNDAAYPVSDADCLYPPPEHILKPLHWVRLFGLQPDVVQWRHGSWWMHGAQPLSVAEARKSQMEYLGPAEFTRPTPPEETAAYACLQAENEALRRRQAQLEAEVSRLTVKLSVDYAIAASTHKSPGNIFNFDFNQTIRTIGIASAPAAASVPAAANSLTRPGAASGYEAVYATSASAPGVTATCNVVKGAIRSITINSPSNAPDVFLGVDVAAGHDQSVMVAVYKSDDVIGFGTNAEPAPAPETKPTKSTPLPPRALRGGDGIVR